MAARIAFAAIAAMAASLARAQQACTLTTEAHPSMSWSTCVEGGICTEVSGSVTVDANWRWTHEVSSSTNCYTGNTWDSSICPDGESCASACCIDGADYSSTYGVTASGDSLSLKYITQGAYSTNIGSRLYMMQDEDNYQMFTLLGNEFTFDVDVSQLSCGLNGALYFVSMDQDGGMAAYSGNQAGAKFGTGYCDAQCAKDLKFIGGVANVDGWTPSATDENSGVGNMGACCAEMDIWEANSVSNAYTPHPCENNAFHICQGDNCGGTYSNARYAGDCDPDGCDFNPFRQGNDQFYGAGMKVDTTKKITVVTQFHAGDDGVLSEIKRFYVQNGMVIENSESTISGNSGNSITPEFCQTQKLAFGDDDIFNQRGGFGKMSDAVSKPMVLVMSLWGDHYAHMLWLDSTYPTNNTEPGGPRGTCATDSGDPADLETSAASATVTFSGIKFGPIGSTFDSDAASDGSSSSSSAAVATSTKATSTVAATSSTKIAVTTSAKATTTSPSIPATTTPATGSEDGSDDGSEDDEEEGDDESCPEETAASSTLATVMRPTQTIGSGSNTEACAPTATVTVTVTVGGPATTSASSGGSVSGSVQAVAAYHQCGGLNWSGVTACADGYTCVV